MCFEEIFSASWKIVNTQFASTIISSFAGAIAGAYGAHYIAEHTKYKKDLLKEIRNTNAAIMLCFDIVNSYLAMKKQLVKPMYDNYNKTKGDLEEFKQKKEPRGQFHFQADFQTLDPIVVPINILQKLIYEKISLNGRSLAAFSSLSRAKQSLENYIVSRNEFIEVCKNADSDNYATAVIYFGLKDELGNTDMTYPH